MTFHTPGMFVRKNEGGQKKQDIDINLGKIYDPIDLDYEYHQLLDVDYGGFPCKKEMEYQKDVCNEKMVEKEMLDKVGCTPPSGLNKSQICKKVEDGDIVSSMDWHYRNGETNYGCYNPCSIFSFATIKSTEYDDKKYCNGKALVKMYFPRYVKVFERSYTYSKLSLIAEVGGYVGLFLGISINQVTHLVDFLLTKLRRVSNFSACLSKPIDLNH